MVALRHTMKKLNCIIGLLCGYLTVHNYMPICALTDAMWHIKDIHVHKAAYTALISKAQLSIQDHSNYM